MSHFLQPLLRRDALQLALVNERTGRVVASRLELAGDSATRNRGLLGRPALEGGDALVLAPCWAVHTWRMRFPIDILFATRDGRIVKALQEVRPWRMAASPRAFAVIEMRAGTLAARRVVAGDRVRVTADSNVPALS
jgi:hypothetical protein